MSRLNTMYPDDEFLKKISDMMGKLDNKNETEIKQEIEQIGYKEFYRYYNEKGVYIKQLQQENQELKLELSGYRQAILEDKDMLGLKEESEELKKQVEEYKEQVNKGLYNTCLPYTTGYNKAIKDKENQQKEFIEWLKAMNRMYQNEYKDIDASEHYNCVLKKYEEIMGDDK